MSTLRSLLSLSLIFVLAASCTTASRPMRAAAPTPGCFTWVSEGLSGAIGTSGSSDLEKTDRGGSFIEGQFQQLGLMPAGENFQQTFAAVTHLALGTTTRLNIAGLPARRGSDFIPLSVSAPGQFSGAVVFVGYGIRAPEFGYDDYAGVDVAGKLALAMRYEPGEDDASTLFGGVRPSRWSDWRFKARAAHEAGAQALILISPPGKDAEEPLPLFRPHGPLERAPLPVFQVKTALIEHVLKRQGVDLAALRAAIDIEQRHHPLALPDLKLSGEIVVEANEVETYNLVGIRRGSGALAEEVVVVATAYDPVRPAPNVAQTPNADGLANAATDEASSVAALLCGVAGSLHQFAEAPGPQRTLVLATFAQTGNALAGSSAYIRAPALPLANTVAMVNLDLARGPREARLGVRGSDPAQKWWPLLTRNDASGLELVPEPEHGRPADHVPFQAMGVAAASLTTAHTPETGGTRSDDAAEWTPQSGAQVAAFVQNLVTVLLTDPERPHSQPAHGEISWLGDGRSEGGFLGTIPDLAQIQKRSGGVPIAAVHPDSPAGRAGLRAGDRIVGMAGFPVPNIDAMTVVLKDHRVGEVMEIEVLRNGRRLRLWAILEPRRSFSP